MGDLFDWGQAAARREDPATSYEAAAAMRGSQAGRMEMLVLAALKSFDGKATAYECERWIQSRHPDIDSNTISPRFKPLETKGLIQRTDERGPGRGSRTQIIWEVLHDT